MTAASTEINTNTIIKASELVVPVSTTSLLKLSNSSYKAGVGKDSPTTLG